MDKTENDLPITYSAEEAIEHYLVGNHALWFCFVPHCAYSRGNSREDLAIVSPLYSQCNCAVKSMNTSIIIGSIPQSGTNTPLDQRKINLFHEYERQLDLYGDNDQHRAILIFTISKTLAEILNECE